MTDDEVLAAIEIDDSYERVRILANKDVGATELVRSRSGELLIRKRIPRELSNREAWERLARIDHPRLPRVERIYELPDQLVVVCEYITGTTVGEMLDRHTRIDIDEAVGIALGLCDVAAALHAADVIHRDISPGNVVVAPDILGTDIQERTYLIDLGVARVHNDRASRDTMALGTWGFSAPEQYGFAQSDGRSDIYAIGRLLTCLLRGKLPQRGEDDLAVLLPDNISDDLRAVIEQACAFEPSARYQSVDAFAEALRYASGRQGASSAAAPHFRLEDPRWNTPAPRSQPSRSPSPSKQERPVPPTTHTGASPAATAVPPAPRSRSVPHATTAAPPAPGSRSVPHATTAAPPTPGSRSVPHATRATPTTRASQHTSGYASTADSMPESGSSNPGVRKRLRAMRNQPSSAKKTIACLAIICLVGWAVLIMLAAILTWAWNQDSEHFIGSYSAPAVAAGSLWASWLVLRYQTDVRDPSDSSLRSRHPLMALLLGLVVVSAVTIIAMLVLMFILGMLTGHMPSGSST